FTLPCRNRNVSLVSVPCASPDERIRGRRVAGAETARGERRDDEEDRYAPRDARRRRGRTRPSRRAAGARPDAHAARALIRGAADALRGQIGRASCRERVYWSVVVLWCI